MRAWVLFSGAMGDGEKFPPANAYTPTTLLTVGDLESVPLAGQMTG